MATELESRTEYQVTPILISEAVVVADGGAKRANRVQVIGVENNFERLASTNIYSDLSGNEIIISENLAVRLSVNEGDNILLRIKKESLIPLNAPFVSDVENSVSFRATIKHIAGKNELGRFFLKNSQTAPLNVFMPLERLNKLLVFEEKANTLLITGENLSELQIELDLKQAWKPKDAGLLFRDVEKSGETEIISERVFLDYQVFDSFGKQPGAKPLLTYFVNGLSAKHSGLNSITPYSFVSTLPENKVQPGEIIINQWLAADLNVGVTDSVWLTYFEIGPLRKLVEKTTGFVVKEVVSMESPYADESLMPYLPGLSDAGDCAEWEAGVPIDLDKIRDKDEDYWDAFKGTPKAFISIKKAEELWSNRFGNYTAIRFDKGTLNNEGFKSLFSALMNPADLGFMVVSVKEKGMYAAQNGVDFSQLFIGLSFFLLIAAILLTSLLFMLNLENRLPQIGTLSVVGFKQKQIRRFFY